MCATLIDLLSVVPDRHLIIVGAPGAVDLVKRGSKMFDIQISNAITSSDSNQVAEPLSQLAEFQLALVGGGTGAVNLE